MTSPKNFWSSVAVEYQRPLGFSPLGAFQALISLSRFLCSLIQISVLQFYLFWAEVHACLHGIFCFFTVSPTQGKGSHSYLMPSDPGHNISGWTTGNVQFLAISHAYHFTFHWTLVVTFEHELHELVTPSMFLQLNSSLF